MKESNDGLLTAHYIQLGWVEMAVSEQEKANEAIEDNEEDKTCNLQKPF